MPLTNIEVRTAKPREKPFKLADSKGLYLQVQPNGSKYWRMKYRYDGKEKVLAFGVFPEVTLREARERLDDARQQLRNSIDPSAAKKAHRIARSSKGANTFEVIANEWLLKEQDGWASSHLKKQSALLQNNLIPALGHLPIRDITAPELLACLKKLESRGVLETTRRTKQIAGQIFRYAITTARADNDPSIALQGALKPPQPTHMPAITEPKKLGAFMRALDEFVGTPSVMTGLKLAPLLFVRSGDLRTMRWQDIDLEKNEWRFIRQKGNEPHIVPLANQSIELLEAIRPISGHFDYVLVSDRSRKRSISDSALNAALRRLGYGKNELVIHGFRATARTLLDEELEFEPHLIEHQLGHVVRDPLGRAYNRTKHLKQRREMMQAWANYLDQLKAEKPAPINN